MTAYELARAERYPDWHDVARESRRPVPPPQPLGERVVVTADSDAVIAQRRREVA